MSKLAMANSITVKEPKKGKGKLTGVRITIAENGFVLREERDYSGDYYPGPGKERVFESKDALLARLKQVLS